MSTEHTPGPWVISHGGFPTDDGFSIATNNAAARHVKVVCECWPCSITGNEQRAELLANARLIAAAPELLAALRWYVANDDTNQDADNQPWLDGLSRARAAIAKAEGRNGLS